MDSRLVFVGNVSSGVTEDMIREFFANGGVTIADEPQAIEIKIGYLFVKCVVDDNLEDNIARLHKTTVPGFEDKPLTVEFSKSNQEKIKQQQDVRRANAVPTPCLFVIGYDPMKVKPHYLEYEFEAVAKVKSVEIFKTYAYVHFFSVEDAIAVRNRFNGKELFGKILTIEFKTSRHSSDRPSNRDTRTLPPPDSRRFSSSRSAPPYDPYPQSFPPPLPLDRRPPYVDDYRREVVYVDRYHPDNYRIRDDDYGPRGRPPVYDTYDPRDIPPSYARERRYRSRSRSRSRERIPYAMPPMPRDPIVPMPADVMPYGSAERKAYAPVGGSGGGRIPRLSNFDGGNLVPPPHLSQSFRREPMDSLRGKSSRSPSPVDEDDDDRY